MGKEALRVVVTGAAGQIGYSLLYMLSSGEVFGHDQPLILQLLDIPPMEGVLEGVAMELNDCGANVVEGIVATSDPTVAFKDADCCFMVGAMPRKEGMERKDLLAANVKVRILLVKKKKRKEKKIRVLSPTDLQSSRWCHRPVRQEDRQSLGRREPGQHQCHHLFPLCAKHPQGELFRHDPLGSQSCHGSTGREGQEVHLLRQERHHLGQPLVDPVPRRLPRHHRRHPRPPGHQRRGVVEDRVLADGPEARRGCDRQAEAVLGHVSGQGRVRPHEGLVVRHPKR